ncbi:MAG: hypothetical protein PHI97_16995 [Desulfobulbus sp.]|nr:hypothetical protein [Desulfobulbus sp.]
MYCTLRDSLFIGFCAVFLVCSRAALRLHLKIPGHSMFFTIFFLFIARGSVPFRWAGTMCGFLSGLMSLTLGMGNGGPLLLVKFVLPGLIVDIMALIFPGMFQSIFLCAFTGVLVGATQFMVGLTINYLMGMDADVLLQHALIKSMGNIIFAAAGGAAVPAVLKKLQAYGVVH